MTFDDLLNIPPLRKSKGPGKVKPKVSDQAKLRYRQAHEQDFKTKYPQAYASGAYFTPTMPYCNKAGGLQNAVIKFLTWHGWYANRISSTGRMIGNKWIPGTTKTGTADLHLIIKGVHISGEVKIGADKMSEDQHLEKSRVEKAGGKYWVIKTFDDFLQQYDNFLLT